MTHSHRIEFQKPDLHRLVQEYTVVDLHFHSIHSDGRDSIKKIARRAQQLGIGVAVTDHNEIKGALEIQKYKQILTIPGIEITSKEGPHLLVYFYEVKSLKHFYLKHVKPFKGNDTMASIDLELSEIIRRARAYNTVIIFAHPYCAAFTGVCNIMFSEKKRQWLLHMADGVEVINAENMKKWNLRSAALGRSLNKSISGGSDGHSISQLGRVVSYADCPQTRKAFLDALRNAHSRVIGKEIDLYHKVRSNGYKLKVGFKNYPNLVEKNLHYSRSMIMFQSKRLQRHIGRNFSRIWKLPPQIPSQKTFDKYSVLYRGNY
jgi:predicted metal-dependent phosphoesterase TrpH